MTATQAIGVVLFANLALAGGKIFYGTHVGSIGLKADGFHNLVDALGSLVALIASGLAAQPPDHDHPYGHRRIELLGTLGVGLFIAAGALEIGWTGIVALWTGEVIPNPDPWGILGVAASTGAVFLLSSWEARVARREGSLLVEVDVAHQRLDIWGTLIVTAGLGLSRLGVVRADAVAALLVLGIVGKGAAEVLTRSAVALSDAVQIDPEKIREVVRTVPRVLGCHKIRSRGAPGAIYVDLHVQVDPQMEILEAHALGHSVKASVEQAFPGVLDVLVHVEPEEPEEARERESREAQAVAASPEVPPAQLR